MPTFNHWKLKSIFTFPSLTAADLQPVFDYLKTHVPTDDRGRASFCAPHIRKGEVELKAAV